MAERLVRDWFPEIAAGFGCPIQIRTAGDEETGDLLRDKLREKADEAAFAGRVELLDELGDVLEVVLTLGEHFGYTPEEIESARIRKREERGGFDRHLVWGGET